MSKSNVLLDQLNKIDPAYERLSKAALPLYQYIDNNEISQRRKEIV